MPPRRPRRDGSEGAPERQLSRRALLGGALLAAPAVSALLSGCGLPQSAAESRLKIASPQHPVRWPYSKAHPRIEPGQTPEPGSTLRIYNYANYLGPRVIKDFEDEYDVTVSVSTFNDEDEALIKIANGGLDLDLYFPSYDSLGRLIAADLLRPLTHDYIPNIANLWPQFTNPWYDQGWRYSVPYSVYTTGIAWRTDMVDADIAAMDNPYDVFWDPTYRSNLAVIDDWHTLMGMVLLRNGVHDVNTTSSAKIAMVRDQLLDLLDKTNPRVSITAYNDLPAGQYGLSQMWSGDAVNAQYYLPKGQSADVLRYWFPSNGRGMVDNDLMVVLAQASNPVAAHVFINYLLDKKIAARNFGYIGYQPPQRSINPQELVADGYLPASLETAGVLPRYFVEGDRLLQLPTEADQEYHQVWQEFKAGG